MQCRAAMETSSRIWIENVGKDFQHIVMGIYKATVAAIETEEIMYILCGNNSKMFILLLKLFN